MFFAWLTLASALCIVWGMTTHPRCFFRSCKTTPTHVVHRLWTVNGKTLPVQHCCKAHIPGTLSHRLPHALQEQLRQRPFYRVEPLGTTMQRLADATTAEGLKFFRGRKG